MYNTPNSLLSVSRSLGITSEEFNLVDSISWPSLMSKFIGVFANGGSINSSFLWEFFDCRNEVVLGSEFLGKASECEFNDDVYLMVEDFGGDKVLGNYWIFESGIQTCVSVLLNHYQFEYYIFDKKFTWVVCENHHNVVVGAGELPSSIREISN